jgi:hypothetical protein
MVTYYSLEQVQVLEKVTYTTQKMGKFILRDS